MKTRCVVCDTAFNPSIDFMEDEDSVEALMHFVDGNALDEMCGDCQWELYESLANVAAGFIVYHQTKHKEKNNGNEKKEN